MRPAISLAALLVNVTARTRNASNLDTMHDRCGQRLGLARPCPGQHQNRAHLGSGRPLLHGQDAGGGGHHDTTSIWQHQPLTRISSPLSVRTVKRPSRSQVPSSSRTPATISPSMCCAPSPLSTDTIVTGCPD